MSLVFIVWLVTTFLPNLGLMVGITTVVAFVIFGFLSVYAFIEENANPLLKFLSYKKSICFVLFLACVIPSKESTWYMVGAYGTQKLIENPVAQDIASDGVDVLKALMKKAKENLEEKSTK